MTKLVENEYVKETGNALSYVFGNSTSYVEWLESKVEEYLLQRDKLLNLLEDQLELERNANYCVHQARKNIEKIKNLFPKKKE